METDDLSQVSSTAPTGGYTKETGYESSLLKGIVLCLAIILRKHDDAQHFYLFFWFLFLF